MTFSLILATFGRKQEIIKFLESILHQEKTNLKEIEIIIIDQNLDNLLDEELEKFQTKLNIIHLKSQTKGLSLNRNIGIKIASGKYIAFPDDDCIYYPNTLFTIKESFENNKDIDACLGRVFSRKNNRNIIRNWKNYNFQVNINNFFLNYTSITIFTKKNNIFFDEQLGLGEYFGAYEDADYVWQLLDKKKKIVYFHNIEVWHPDPKEQLLNYDKIYSYGLGFGALVRKHLSFYALFLFLKVIAYHLVRFIYKLISFKKIEAKKSWVSLISRIKGFMDYK